MIPHCSPHLAPHYHNHLCSHIDSPLAVMLSLPIMLKSANDLLIQWLLYRLELSIHVSPKTQKIRCARFTLPLTSAPLHSLYSIKCAAKSEFYSQNSSTLFRFTLPCSGLVANVIFQAFPPFRQYFPKPHRFPPISIFVSRVCYNSI